LLLAASLAAGQAVEAAFPRWHRTQQLIGLIDVIELEA